MTFNRFFPSSVCFLLFCSLILWVDSSAQKESNHASEATIDAGNIVYDKAKQTAMNGYEGAKQRVENAADLGKEHADEAGEKAKSWTDWAKEKTGSLKDDSIKYLVQFLKNRQREWNSKFVAPIHYAFRKASGNIDAATSTGQTGIDEAKRSVENLKDTGEQAAKKGGSVGEAAIKAAKEQYEKAQEAVKKAAEYAKGTTDDASEGAKEQYERAKETVSQKAGEYGEAMRSGSGETVKQAKESATGFSEKAREAAKIIAEKLGAVPHLEDDTKEL